jgi:hypothetical protein
VVPPPPVDAVDAVDAVDVVAPPWPPVPELVSVTLLEQPTNAATAPVNAKSRAVRMRASSGLVAPTRRRSS